MEQLIKSVAKLTPELAAQLMGQDAPGMSFKFNPVLDADGNSIISLSMAQYLNANQYEVIDFKPIQAEEV
ncbi:hypothetical protein FUA48_16015 [Flavobacterium alkalisoli]|uniref:Uncharacterized protein n=1 Tax=Flavobacterium alkalisoli TaxID=2602769 RepID=A0A5B9FYC1_9FLAO|nr:hypothetical protein [Flavobacterium alkalisoli]QEE51026.1 hypothetical protein FUA48_16015 [Flavobacterium alkalisoli]